jgi:uncharacterized iron-regulated membrane protein
VRILRVIHAYTGLALGLILALLAVTGGALIFKDEIWRLQYPELRAGLQATQAEGYATAFREIDARFPEGVGAIKVPRDGVPAYHVYTANGEALVSPENFAIIDSWRWYQSATGILSEIHFHLLAGGIGKNVGGFVALASAGLAVAGVFLWWPARRGFRVKRLLARSGKRAELLRMHRDFGILAAASIALFSITAAGVIFYPAARSLLNGLFSDRAAAEVTMAATANKLLLESPSEQQVVAALAALPDARLTTYYPPSASRATHYFRFQHPDEHHPNGRSAVYISPGDTVPLQVIDATREPTGERAAQLLYPLHAAMIGGPAYTLFACLSAIVITLIGVSGPLAFLRRQPKP